MGVAIAKSFGIHAEDTLTGFKYIAERIEECRQKQKNEFLFGYEESYGFLIRDFIRDKDAIQAAVMVAEVAALIEAMMNKFRQQVPAEIAV